MRSTNYVCYDCFKEKSIKLYIKRYATNTRCDYCGRRSSNSIAIDFNELATKIEQSLSLEYLDPYGFLFSDDDTSWDDVIDSYDMFHNDYPGLGIENTELIDDLANYFSNRAWFKESNFYHTESYNLQTSWDYFCYIVRNEWRYTYFLSDNLDYEPETLNPIDLLKRINSLIEMKEIVITIPKSTDIFRARFHCKNDKINAKTVGTPIAKYVQTANRFSPIGIPMFYGSLSKDTCLDEIIGNRGRKNYYTIATFENNEEIPVLDLTKRLKIPGRYSDENVLIEPIKFLNTFSQIISKPARKNDEYLDYIPTQVFTEFLRHQSKQSNFIKGIKYNSSKGIGVNVVLFYTNDQCFDQHNHNMKDILILKEIETKKIMSAAI